MDERLDLEVYGEWTVSFLSLELNALGAGAALLAPYPLQDSNVPRYVVITGYSRGY